MAKYKFKLKESKELNSIEKNRIETFLTLSLSETFKDKTKMGKLITEFVKTKTISVLTENNKTSLINEFNEWNSDESKSKRAKLFLSEWREHNNGFKTAVDNLINAYNKKNGL